MPSPESDRPAVVPEDWPTYREIARLLLVSPKTIRNRMWRHQLPRVFVKVGRHHRLTARISPETARELARRIGTLPISAFERRRR